MKVNVGAIMHPTDLLLNCPATKEKPISQNLLIALMLMNRLNFALVLDVDVTSRHFMRIISSLEMFKLS